MNIPRGGWKTLPWWMLVLLIGAVAYWIVATLLCLGIAHFGSGPSCTSLDGAMAAYRALMKWAKYRHDELQALSGVAIFVLMFILAICAYRLWRHGVQVAGIQARDTQAALAAARQASETALRSAEVAQAALAGAQRPWLQVLAVESATDLAFDPAGASLQVDVRVKNVGYAPALDVDVHVEMRSEGALGAELTEPAGAPSGTTLFPGQDAALTAPVQLRQGFADVASRPPVANRAAGPIDDEPPLLFLVGAVSYGSPLDGSRRRTEFCFALLDGGASGSGRASDLQRGRVTATGPAPGKRPTIEPARVGPRRAT